jgi:hypothetical protein
MTIANVRNAVKSRRQLPGKGSTLRLIFARRGAKCCKPMRERGTSALAEQRMGQRLRRMKEK